MPLGAKSNVLSVVCAHVCVCMHTHTCMSGCTETSSGKTDKNTVTVVASILGTV